MAAATFTPEQRARGHRRKRADHATGKARRDVRLPYFAVLVFGVIVDSWVADPSATIGQVAIARAVRAPVHHDDQGRPIVPAHVTRAVSLLVELGYLDRDAAEPRWNPVSARYGRARCNRYELRTNPGVARPVTWSPSPAHKHDSPGTCSSSCPSIRPIGAPVMATRTPTIDPCPACGRPPGPCPLADPTHCGRAAPP
jgi:hypothetical protein